MTRSRLTLPKLVVIGVVLMALSGGYALATWVDRATTAEKAGAVVATEGDDLATRVLEACRTGGEAAAALADTRACEQAGKTRETIEEQPVEPDPSAAAPPVSDQVVRLPGTQGPRGPGPTLAQIGRAVAAVIDDVVADQIDQAVQDQIDAAVARNCGGSCKGEKGDSIKGDKGDSVTGPAGADAPRVRSIACDDTTGVFTFTDDSTIRVDGMCDEPGPLEPAPEPTP